MNDTYSDFWLDEDIVENENYSTLDINLIKLANYKSSISNFVRILTNKNIPVKFKTTGNSSTDGETVYITSNITCRDDFDVTVGLALHESAHIVLSDFDIFKTLWQRIPREIYELSEKCNMSKESVWELTKDMINYVEDRYIDWYIYTTAVGYRGYYLKLYSKYFNNSINDIALKSELYRNLDVDSYTFRIFNFTNQNTDLSALPDLKEIFELINYENIDRLTTPHDRFLIATECTKLILKNIKNDDITEKPSDESNKSDTLTDDTAADEQNLPDKDENEKEQESKTNENNNTQIDNVKKENTDTKKLKKSQIDKIKSNFKNQKKFMNHQLSKKGMSKSDEYSISNIENSGMTLFKVGGDYFGTEIDCVFVKNLTKELLMDDRFPLSRDNFQETEENKKCISNGIVLGKLLGKKLQVRNYINTTKYMRKSSGKIDRKTLSDLAFNSQNVFYINHVDKYKRANIHISVDASSSMVGEKWRNTITTVVAICKACSMIDNVNVVVSFRTSIKRSDNDDHIPYVVIAYDSSKDSFVKIKNYFCHIFPSNTTPEGLCFEPIVKNLPAKNLDEDYYFINLSDGLPYLSVNTHTTELYQGTKAAEHTRNQIKKVIQSGYEVLSYYIQTISTQEQEIIDQFKLMYGKNASFVNVKNLIEIAKTLNVMFLKKEN